MIPLDWLARWQSPPWSDVQHALRSGRLSAERGPRGIDLRGIDLRGASLGAIDLSGAALAFARLDGARLDGAILTGVYAPFLSGVGVRLDGAILDGARLQGSNLAVARLVRADLRYADLHGASLAGADLRAANARGVNWRGCDHEGAWLWGAARDRTCRSAAECHLRGYPSFAELFDHWHWRSLARPAPIVVPFLEGLAWGAPRLDDELRALIGASDGLALLAAVCTLALVAESDAAPHLETLWQRLQAWPYYAPQVAVALFLFDPRFDARARQLLSSPGIEQKVGDALTALCAGGAGSSIAARFLAKLRELAPPAARRRWQSAVQ